MKTRRLSENQAEEELAIDLAAVSDFLERSSRLAATETGKQQLFKLFYVPDDRLIRRLQDYENWYRKVQRAEQRNDRKANRRKNVKRQLVYGENPGELMEEIAYLAFSCLRGADPIKAGQSYAPQHDLIVSGSSTEWNTIMGILHLSPEGRTIIVEAKNTKEPVDDQQFSRLCYILQNKFSVLSQLGVFFSRSGAKGFPTDPDRSQRSIRGARATQITFHAATRKFVVVLSHEEILRLKEKGALLHLLEGLIRDIEEALGNLISLDENWKEKDVLPAHLLKYTSQS